MTHYLVKTEDYLERSLTSCLAFTPHQREGMKGRVTIYNVTVDNRNGRIVRGGPRSWNSYVTLPIDAARKVWKDRVSSGWQVSETLLQGKYWDQQ